MSVKGYILVDIEPEQNDSNTVFMTSESMYIILIALIGIAFMIAIGLLGYIIHFIYCTFYKLLVIEERCSCGRSRNSREHDNNNFIAIEIQNPHPPSYSQILEEETKDLPKYEEVVRTQEA